jgi:hypothetical protein
MKEELTFEKVEEILVNKGNQKPLKRLLYLLLSLKEKNKLNYIGMDEEKEKNNIINFYDEKEEKIAEISLRGDRLNTIEKLWINPEYLKDKFRYYIKTPGVIFIQQDNYAGTCSHACVRMLASFFNLHDELTFEKIGQMLRNTSFPTSGLNTEEVIEILKKIGTNPLVYSFTKGKTKEGFIQYWADEIIYYYIESGIPCYVALETRGGTGHAIVIIGHTFDEHAWWPEAQPAYYHAGNYIKPTNWINFIIHDDNFGPYLTMDTSLRKNIYKVIIPFPYKDNKLKIYPEQAEELAYSFIVENRENFRKHSKIEDIHVGNFIKHLKNNALVLRTFLIEKEIFLESIKKSYRISQKLKRIYLSPLIQNILLKNLNKFWLVEISIPELFSSLRYRIGEAVIDPYCSFDECPILIFHLPGLIFIKNRNNKKLQPYAIKDDKFAYEHLLNSYESRKK